MPINPNASIEITAFKWVPEMAQGHVRDLRVRWALEEAGLEYRVRLLGMERPSEYLREQPFDQVPAYRDDSVQIFESGAIVQYIGEKTEGLLPREPQPRMRAIQWTYATLNSVEPAVQAYGLINSFYAGQEWAKLRSDGARDFALLKLRRVAEWLGAKPWLEGDRFTIGDLMMTTVLRMARSNDLLADMPTLDRYLNQAESRPAFRQALADHLAPFGEHQPQGVAA
jgi:glutathione S-transferase